MPFGEKANTKCRCDAAGALGWLLAVTESALAGDTD